MAKQNPTMPKDSLGLDSPLAGIDNLPNAIGVNQKALSQANEFPGHGAITGTHSMSPNDGDQKDVATPPFANGSDLRSYRPSPGNAPDPAKPGALH